MDSIEAKGQYQTIHCGVWDLDHVAQKVAEFHTQIINPRAETIRNNTLVFAELAEELITVGATNVCESNRRTVPVQTMVETLGSAAGMTGRVAAQIETAQVSLLDPRRVKITVVICWQVLVIAKKECPPGPCPPGYFEKSGLLTLAPGGATSWEDGSNLKTISYVAHNMGPDKAELYIEGSPDQSVAFRNTPPLELAAHGTLCLVPKNFVKYYRLTGICTQKALVKYWLQALH